MMKRLLAILLAATLSGVAYSQTVTTTAANAPAAGAIATGTPVVGGTANCVLYADSAVNFQCDGTNFKWDATNKLFTAVGQIRASDPTNSAANIGGLVWSGNGFFIDPGLGSTTNRGLGIGNSRGQINISAGSGWPIIMTSGNGSTLTLNTTSGQGPSIVAGTATTDVAALSVTRTNNNAAVATGVKFTFTDTTSAAGFLPFQITGTSSGTANLLSLSKSGNLNIAGQIQFAALGAINVGSDGVFTLLNNAQTDFGRLQFGGTSSGFPALKRSGSGLQAKLADDSDYANFTGQSIGAATNFQTGSGGIVGWTSAALTPFGTVDTALSRISAGVVGVGTGAAGSTAGTLQANQLTSVGGTIRLANSAGDITLSGSVIQIPATTLLGWSDLMLARDAANTLAQRNGTNAQTFNIYETYTDASNYARLTHLFNVSEWQIRTEAAGTGTARQLVLGTGGSGRWTISTSGHLLAYVDNTYDIGASGATRPRNAYFGNRVTAADVFLTDSASKKVLIAPITDGALGFSNNSGARGVHLRFTGTPTCSTNCGTSPTVVGVDTAGTVTMGATGAPASGWVLTFASTWTAAPSCHVTPALAGMAVGKLPVVVATTTTTMTVTTNGTAPANSDVYTYQCIQGI